MFWNPSCERSAPPSSPHHHVLPQQENTSQRTQDQPKSRAAYRGRPTAVAVFTSETLGFIETHNLCWFAFLKMTAEGQVHFPVPADHQHWAPWLSCDSTTCFLSLKSQTLQKSCPQLFSTASWRVQKPNACFVPIGTCSPRMVDKNPKELKKVQESISRRKHFWFLYQRLTAHQFYWNVFIL